MKLLATDTERARAAVLRAVKHLDCESIGEALAYALCPGGKLPDSTCRRGKDGHVVLEYYADADEDEADIVVERQSMAEASSWELGALLTLTGCKTPHELGFKYSVTYGWTPSTWHE